ncbi:MAG TPA: cytochrome C oxidase subunit I, partial [Aquifex aeolicus]|nr:cytochrome C oxidase subunit I [Aquifex aeolicus]
MNPWFLLFLASIGAGGFFALLIAVARTPVLSSLIPQNLFYHWLVGHVDLTLIIGLLSFLAFLWSEKFKTEEKFYRLLLAYGGALGVFLSALLGFGKPVDNNYVPTLHHPLFFISMALFFLGYTLRSLSLTKASIKNPLSPEPLKSTL